MKTNDETVLENAAKSESQKEETQLKGQAGSVKKEAQPKADAKKSVSWKQVAMGGVSGIALGAAGILFSGATLPGDAENNEEGAQGGEGAPEPSNLAPGVESQSAISVAEGINDEMTFSEAFAAARKEVGPNGVFVWHGQAYTTCYAEEWSALSTEEQSAFSSNALEAVGEIPPYEGKDETAQNANGEGEGEGGDETAQNGEGEGEGNSETAQNGEGEGEGEGATAQNGEGEGEGEGGEEVLAQVAEPANAEPGAEEPNDGEDVHVIGFEEPSDVALDGGSNVFINEDEQGTLDLMAPGDDNNGLIDDLTPDATTEEIDTTNVSDPIVDDMYAQMPDYTNDADVSSLV